MRKIEKRGIFCLILAALLGIGLALFCFRFVMDGDDWASYPYNRHLYSNSGQLKGGTILDRDGDVLSSLDENGNRVYYPDSDVRRATLHAVGDPARDQDLFFPRTERDERPRRDRIHADAPA